MGLTVSVVASGWFFSDRTEGTCCLEFSSYDFNLSFILFELIL